MSDKIICHCLEISEDAIIEAKNSGCKSLEDIQDKTGANTVCGACATEIEEILESN